MILHSGFLPGFVFAHIACFFIPRVLMEPYIVILFHLT